MSKLIDMTGWRMSEHGVSDSKITVIDRAENNSHGKAMWNCQCDCGKIFTTLGTSLRNGNTKSCGCMTRKNAKQHLIKMHQKNSQETMIGQKFGKLTVIKDTGERGASGLIIYLCKCDCGNFCKRIGSNLKNPNYFPSCGCIHSPGEAKIIKILTNNNINFIQEKVFQDCIFKDSNRPAKFDFYILDKNYIIEYDGQQHFYPNKFFNNISEEEAELRLQKTQEHDNLKNQYCKEHNIPLIRIPYTHLKDLCLEDLLLETSNFILA